MSSFKRLNNSDVFVLPYTANKQYSFPQESLSENGIILYTGEKSTGSLDLLNEEKEQHVYKRLIFDTINQLFYQQYSGSLIDTHDLLHTRYYESASQYRPTASYDNCRIWNDRDLYYPTGYGEEIKVLSIPQKLYGQAIKRGSFRISSSDYYIVDDHRGNLVDVNAVGGDFNDDYSDDFFNGIPTDAHAGNIYYAHGLVVITTPYYSSMFDEPEYCNPVTGVSASVSGSVVYFAFTGSLSDVLFYNVQLHQSGSNSVVTGKQTANTTGSFIDVQGGDYYISVQVHCDENNLSGLVNSAPVHVIQVALTCPVVTAVNINTPAAGVVQVLLSIPQIGKYGTDCTIQLINSSDSSVYAAKTYIPGQTNQFTGVAPGTYYVGCIRHCNNGVDSTPVNSSIITVAAPVVCNPATNLMLTTDGSGSLSGSWNNSVSAMSNYNFTLYKDNAAISAAVKTASDPAVYNASNVAPGNYYYRLTTHCSNGLQSTADSNMVAITACGISVTGFTVMAVSGSFNLLWTNNGGTPNSFLFEYSTDNGDNWTSGSMNVSSSKQAGTSADSLALTQNYKWRITPYCSPGRPGTPATADYTYVAASCAMVNKPVLNIPGTGALHWSTSSPITAGETLDAKLYLNGTIDDQHLGLTVNSGSFGLDGSGTYTIELIKHCTNGVASSGIMSDGYLFSPASGSVTGSNSITYNTGDSTGTPATHDINATWRQGATTVYSGGISMGATNPFVDSHVLSDGTYNVTVNAPGMLQIFITWATGGRKVILDSDGTGIATITISGDVSIHP